MRVYDDICDMLNNELSQIAQKRELTSNSLEVMSKAVDIVKDLSIVKAMEEAGYSEHYPWYMYGDDMYAMNGRNSYGNSYTGNSYGRGRYAKRDSMGRYSSAGSDQLMNQLQNLMNTTQDENDRQMIKEWMDMARKG